VGPRTISARRALTRPVPAYNPAMRRRECTLLVTVAIGIVGAALGTLGCRGDARRAQLRSTNPLDRAAAIVRVAESGDLRAVHKLVDLLEDEDSAVRMYAILALRRLCGQDFGYRYFDNVGTRSSAVRRWRDGLRAGSIQVHPATQPSVIAADADPAQGPAAGAASAEEPR